LQLKVKGRNRMMEISPNGISD